MSKRAEKPFTVDVQAALQAHRIARSHLHEVGEVGYDAPELHFLAHLEELVDGNLGTRGRS